MIIMNDYLERIYYEWLLWMIRTFIMNDYLERWLNDKVSNDGIER
jgi:hypothetical protein